MELTEEGDIDRGRRRLDSYESFSMSICLMEASFACFPLQRDASERPKEQGTGTYKKTYEDETSARCGRRGRDRSTGRRS